MATRERPFAAGFWSNIYVCVRVDPQKSQSMEQPTKQLVVIPATTAAVIINDLILGLPAAEREKPSMSAARKSERFYHTP